MVVFGEGGGAFQMPGRRVQKPDGTDDPPRNQKQAPLRRHGEKGDRREKPGGARPAEPAVTSDVTGC